jgi:TonB family protein
MMLAMKTIILVIALIVFPQANSPTQNPSSPQDNSPATTAKKKSKVIPPKEIDAPFPKPTFDEGKRSIIIAVMIGVDGLVRDPKIIQSSDSVQADANALEAVKTWKYRPATQDGVPVAVWINIQINPRPFPVDQR